MRLFTGQIIPIFAFGVVLVGLVGTILNVLGLRKRWDVPRWFLSILLVLSLLVTGGGMYGLRFRTFRLPSSSMAPAFPSDSRILVEETTFIPGMLKRFECVVFFDRNINVMRNRQGNAYEIAMKRVIGLPGETVEIRANQGVFINGELLPEPFVTHQAEYDWPTKESGLSIPYHIPASAYFVLGDNRNMSLDSHNWINRAGKQSPDLPLVDIAGRVVRK